MAWKRIRDLLFPGAAEREPLFGQKIVRASHAGLRGLGPIEIAAALLLAPHWIPLAAQVILGAATLLVARQRWSRTRARTLSVASAAGVLLVAGWAHGQFSIADALVILVAAVVALPLLPVHAIALGAITELWWLWRDPGNELFLLVITLVAAGAAIALYERRFTTYHEQQEALRIAEALSGAQLRAQLAENAVAIGKLAAAVTHEINTPLGSLTSAVDTLLVLAGKQASSNPAQQERMANLQADLRRSVQTATERIRGVIARLQRFINLEEAELQTANVNELLRDVIMQFDDQLQRGVQLEFEFEPVPTLMCRPQLLSAAFSTLLSNAIKAADGDGRVVVSTRHAGSLVEISIQDNGHGMSPEQIETIFDPGFKVTGTRIASGNWSLFNSRQIVFEHGGDIRIASAEGKGTTVWVTLPAA